MDQSIELQLIEACRSNRDNKTTSLGDVEHKSDVSRYLSPERLQRELDKVFRPLPSLLVHSSELPQPNSFVSVDSAIGPLIATRDAQGVAHVFRNSCRHRGAKIVNGSGCNKRLICPYHAWSYTTGGELSNVPGQAHCFPKLDKATNGLIEISCVEKYGFLWLCASASDAAQAEQDVDASLGDMSSHMQWLQADNFKLFKRTSKVWNGNWKLFAEGGLETYHFAFAHKETIASSFYNNTAVIDQLGRHFRVVMPTKELELDNVASLHDCSHTLFLLVPNTAILVQKHHADWIHFRPLGVDKTEISVATLVPKDFDESDAKQHQHWTKNHHITNVTLDEDWELGASIQASLNTGAMPYIQYGRNEWALHEFNQVLDELLATD